MDYLVSGSQDLTLKCWKVPQIFEVILVPVDCIISSEM